jgi:molecular chaperone DnaJ
VEPGTQPGAQVVLRGKGVPHVGASGRGNLHVRFRVDVPRKLSARQEELLKELAAEDGLTLEASKKGGLFGRRRKR